MGIEDRPYMQEDDGPTWRPGGGAGGMQFGLPKPGLAVKWLLILNIGMFVVQLIDRGGYTTVYLSAWPPAWWQLWRYITFQFLHGGAWHLIGNMLGVYFLGTPLERRWGTRRFTWFFLTCGATGGVLHVAVSLLAGGPELPLLGASGGVYGTLLAAAVLFPHMRLIFMFFPVPIRLAAVILFAVMALGVLGGAGGSVSHLAHFGGVATAAFWLWGLPKLRASYADADAKRKHNAWQKQVRQRQAEEKEVDRILEKIKREGINSLTPAEKKQLQDATRRQRDQDRWIDTGH